MESDTIRGHRLNNIYNPIFELTLIPEQIAMIDEVCKPFINQNNKSDIDDAVLYVSSANRKEVNCMNNRRLNTIQKRENLNHVFAIDEKGNGGANHKYAICRTDLTSNDDNYPDYYTVAFIDFQNGARNDENSTMGVLDTDLLEIVRDRLVGFQSGEFATEYNAKALEYIELALMYMNRRVEDRIERNVFGTYKK